MSSYDVIVQKVLSEVGGTIVYTPTGVEPTCREDAS